MFTVFGRAYPAYEIDRPRDHKPLVVLSAGHDLPISGPHVQILRPEGRRDYQILYIRSGCAHFFWDGKDHVISGGQIVLYRPGEYQRYEYRIEDTPDVYWIHFTGSSVEEELDGMGLKQQVFPAGANDQYAGLFDSIIQELQFKDAHFDDMAASYLKELLCLFSGELLGQRAPTHTPRTREVEDAVSFFQHPLQSAAESVGICGPAEYEPVLVYPHFPQANGGQPQAVSDGDPDQQRL